MPMRDRRRPAPIRIVPRQQPSATGTPEPESPETPGSPPSPTGGPESPDSPSPTNASFEPPSPTESSVPGVSSTTAVPSITSPGQAPTASSQTSALPAVTSAVATSSPPTPSSLLIESSVPPSDVNLPAASTQGTSVLQSKRPVTTQVTTSGTVAPAITAPSNPNGNANSDFSSKNAQPVKPSTSTTNPSPAQSDTSGSVGTDQPQKFRHEHGIGGMSKGAEAALITCSVLGAIALIAGLIFFFKRRRRRQQAEHRHAEDAFNPSNTGSLSHPETSAVGYTSHFTRSTTTTTPSLFAGDPTHRPETVSTNDTPPASRIQPPQPTPNPFADPPLQKAYDVLRGRPRSTTLTDRGSWLQNPFKDPESQRFDPFGELQEKARQERRRYMEEVRRENEAMREQEFLEKERMGLGVPGTLGGISAGGQARKGSGVTIEGVGVLDRSGDERYGR